MPVEGILCPACGFDQEAGARRPRTYEPVDRTWESGWPLPRRVRLFWIGQAVFLPLGVLGAWFLGEWAALMAPWLVVSALTAFLLGTFARTELLRNERGKVRISLTWRICFLLRPTETIRRSEYEGVISAKGPAAGTGEWIVLIVLLLSGLLPGVRWWRSVMQRDSYFVALTRDHGFPERTLYWGRDGGQAEEMAKTIRAVAFGPT
jgi:hypothetical protein